MRTIDIHEIFTEKQIEELKNFCGELLVEGFNFLDDGFIYALRKFFHKSEYLEIFKNKGIDVYFFTYEIAKALDKQKEIRNSNND